MAKVRDPLTDTEQTRPLTADGRIIPYTDEVPAIIEKYIGMTDRQNRVIIHKKIKATYIGISHKNIQDSLNKREQENVIFDNPAPLIPVSSPEPMHRIQCDLVNLGTRQSPRLVLSVLDVFSRFLWMEPIKSKSSQEVASKLEDIFYNFGAPKILQCDNGGEFRGVVEHLCKSEKVHIIRSRPDHPQSQGKVYLCLYKCTAVSVDAYKYMYM